MDEKTQLTLLLILGVLLIAGYNYYSNNSLIENNTTQIDYTNNSTFTENFNNFTRLDISDAITRYIQLNGFTSYTVYKLDKLDPNESNDLKNLTSTIKGYENESSFDIMIYKNVTLEHPYQINYYTILEKFDTNEVIIISSNNIRDLIYLAMTQKYT